MAGTPDFSYLLNSSAPQMPNPLAMAQQGMTLADLSNQLQTHQLALQQSQQYMPAVQAMLKGTPLAQVGEQFPGAYAKILADQKQLQLTQAQIEEAQGKGAQANAAAATSAMGIAGQLGNGLAQKVAAGQPLSPMDKQMYVSQMSHALTIQGIPPEQQNLPSLTDPDQAFASAGAASASAATSAIDASNIAKNTAQVPADVQKTLADTLQARTTAALAPFLAQTGRMSATAATSEAASKQAALDIQRVTADPLGLFGLNKGGGAGVPQAVPGAAATPQGGQTFNGLPLPQGMVLNAAGNPQVPPALQNQRDQTRLQMLYQERAQNGANVDPALAKEISMQEAALGQQGGAQPQQPQAGQPPMAGGGAMAAIGSNLHGPDLLAQIPGPVGDQVKALAEGRMQFPAGTALRTPYWQAMLSLTSQYDPNFDAVNYNSRAATRKDFTSGTAANSLNAINTVMQHMNQLDTSASALNNTSIPIWNTVANTAANETGDPRIANFDTAKQTVINELERAYRGSSGTEGDLARWNDMLTSASSPAQFKGVVQQMTNLLGGKIDALGSQYNKGMGTSQNGLQLLNPQAQAVFNRLSGGAPAPQSATTTAKSALPSVNRDAAISGALDAISRGAPKAAVMQRLQQMGITDASL